MWRIFALAALLCGHSHAQVKNFGQGISQGRVRLTEETVYDYKVSSGTSRGVLTHFWITGGDYVCGGHDGPCRPPLNSSNNWNPVSRLLIA